MRRFVTGLLIVVSALALFLSSTSLWVRHNVINTDVFVSNVDAIVDLPQVQARVDDQVTTTVMAQPQVQDAIDQAVAVLPPRLQQFRLTVESGVQSLVSTGVRHLLTNQPFKPLRDAAITSAHTQLVNGQPVQFTLGQAKARIPDSEKSGIAGQVLDLLPSSLGVTLITPADAPRLYNAIDLLESVWWWVGLIFLVTLAGALYLSPRRRKTLRAWSVTTAVLAFLALLALRIARGPVVAAAKPENRDALGAVYDHLAGGLRSWTLWLLAIALFVLVETLVWGHLGIVAGIRRGWAAARGQVRRRREEHQAARASAAQEGLPEGAAPAPIPKESWPRRLAEDTRAFVAAMDLDRRAAAFGTFVDAHLRVARWTGIVLGAIVLLLWPSPTLSVLIWIVAVVALYIGLLEWLRSKAPQAETEEATLEGIAAAEQRALEGRHATPAVSAVRPGPVGTAGGPAAPPPEPPGPPVPTAISAEVISTLNDRLDLLVRLGAARDAGVLSEDEFHREKERLQFA